MDGDRVVWKGRGRPCADRDQTSGKIFSRLFVHTMTTTLPLFWHLSSASKEERISASVKLIATLQKFQVQFATKEQPPFDDEEDDENSPADPLDALNAQDVSYSMRRLIRGLASPRESSRLGFAVALTEVSFYSPRSIYTTHKISPAPSLS